ncbi:MAG: sigma-54-dependent Fis family transcriptional regulator, partial [Bacteroidetes bacterium]|nr:sigma-54-dependent Fis family transcriptional regulator [Bacteroidota bacterium]
FRDDLFYRLNMFSIGLPPLRERCDDLYELVDHFISKYNKELHKNLRTSAEAIAALGNYNWPGNVRELENVIAQAAILADGDVLEPKYLPTAIKGDMREEAPKRRGVKSQVGSLEREIIRKVLEESDWNQSKAAGKLGIHRATLQYKIKKYGIASPRKDASDSS